MGSKACACGGGLFELGCEGADGEVVTGGDIGHDWGETAEE